MICKCLFCKIKFNSGEMKSLCNECESNNQDEDCWDDSDNYSDLEFE